MYAARGRLPRGNVFGFVYAVSLFVGAAYMPPGRGVLHAGFAGRIHAAPTMRETHHTSRKRAAAAVALPAVPDFLSGQRPRSSTIFHFYFLIFNLIFE